MRQDRNGFTTMGETAVGGRFCRAVYASL